MIKIVNYGLGNVKAFFNIYKSLNINCEICEDPSALKNATKIILPGVGSFDWAMNKLNSSGMRGILDELVLEKRVPILGICIGMQIMANSSEEGNEKGLSWIKGENVHLKKNNQAKITLPHMGWNNVIDNGELMKNIEDPNFYFLHSYHLTTEDNSIIDGYAHYGKDFICSISKNKTIFGVQFHPEKSHYWGVKLLSNFANL